MSEPQAVLSSDELLEGHGTCVEVAGQHVALFRTAEGVFAIEDECPHAGAKLSEGWLAGGEVVCPLHLWQFKLRDGVGTTEPKSSVASYPVEERDGQIWITLA